MISGSKPGYAPLNAENSLNTACCFTVASYHLLLHSCLNITCYFTFASISLVASQLPQYHLLLHICLNITCCFTFASISLVASQLPQYHLLLHSCLNITCCFTLAYAHKKIYILLSVLNIIFFLFYDVNLHTQDFVYFEIVKYQLGLRRHMPVLEKCNVYISAI